ncbi:atlastin-2-like isoform X2 [Ornithodoros turicata]|uniref:atlastin-2-like isoform X2 n=1 Tax=Ornithodoros turicata TaxID=34597 RepID=UPI003138E236
MSDLIISTVKGTLLSTEPVPVIVQSESEGSVYELHRNVLDHSMWKGVEDLPVVVVSIAGVFRSGKSFLFDYFIRYLEHLEGNRASKGWMGKALNPLKGFPWKYGRNKVTSGILLWGKIFKIDTPRWGTVALVLMDTEGTDDNMSSLASNSTLFSLALLLSSTMIYNVVRSLNRSVLENLQFFVSCAHMLKRAQHCKEDEKSYALEHLLFLVRDWEFVDEIPYGFDKAGDFIAQWLTPDHSAPDSLNNTRNEITRCIKDISSFLMPHPGHQIKELTFNGGTHGLREDFKTQLDNLVSVLLSPENLVPKMLNGRPVTCDDFKGLLLTYSSLCKRGKLPDVQTVTDQAAFVHNQKVLKNIDQEYELAITDEVEEILKAPDAVDKIGVLNRAHDRLKREALSKLGNAPVMGNRMNELQEQLSQMIDVFYAKCKKPIVFLAKEPKMMRKQRAAESQFKEHKKKMEDFHRQTGDTEEDSDEEALYWKQAINKMEDFHRQTGDTEEHSEEGALYWKQAFNKGSDFCTNAKRDVIARHMKQQGVLLEKEDKKKYACALATTNIFRKILTAVCKRVAPALLSMLLPAIAF